MVGRVKFEVRKNNGSWKTAYSTIDMLDINRLLFLCFGFDVRVDGIQQTGVMLQAA